MPLLFILSGSKFSIRLIQGVRSTVEVELAAMFTTIGVNEGLAGIEIVTLAATEKEVILKYIGRSYWPYKGSFISTTSGAANQKAVSVWAAEYFCADRNKKTKSSFFFMKAW